MYDYHPEHISLNPEWKRLIHQLHHFTENKVSTVDENLQETLLFDVLELYVKDKQQFLHHERSLELIKKPTARKELLYRLIKAKQYIQEAPLEHLYLENIASHACLSVYYFLRMFKTVFGHSPYQSILDRKMKMAKQLLFENSEATIQDIAFSCQYYDVSAFIRVFKRYYQVTPGQMRELKAGYKNLCVSV